MELKIQGKQILKDDGSLFFYCADTCWELFHKLTFAEACQFIDNRAAKGFNVLQAVAVAELDGLKTPAYEGALLPFEDLETLKPNEAYFDHAARVISYANKRGLFIALVPMWGSYIVPNLSWGGKVKPIFDLKKAQLFAGYLAEKFKSCDVIWMLGGDRSYITREHKDIIKAMAQEIRKVSAGKQLITAHTQGGRSLWDMLEQPDYLDFITWQSGHMGESYPSYRAIAMDYKRLPIPVLDAEPCYESHPVMNDYSFSRSDCGSRFTAKEVRRSSWWSVFSGGAGITYGCYAIWQMHREEDEKQDIPESAASAYKADAIPFWHESLNFPGAFQIPLIKRFIEKLPGCTSWRPAPELILSADPSDDCHRCAITNAEHDFIAAYVPGDDPVTIDIQCFGLGGFVIYWFDPRYGIYNRLSDDNSESFFLKVHPPKVGNDFVLLLVRKGVPFNPR